MQYLKGEGSPQKYFDFHKGEMIFSPFLLSRAGVDRVFSPVNTFHQINSRIIEASDGGYQRQEKYLPLHVGVRGATSFTKLLRKG